MAKREFVQLAKPYSGESITGYFASEKLDGLRAIWDGGMTRGIPTKEVPFANTTKDHRYVNEQIATGLWTRYGKPIQAPDWFLDQMPSIQLDGELWLGRGMFQTLISTVKQLNADERWKGVRYHTFNIPSFAHWLAPGEINNPTATFEVKSGTREWAMSRCNAQGIRYLSQPQTFLNVRKILTQYYDKQGAFIIHKQIALSDCPTHACQIVDKMNKAVLLQGGEGLILSNGYAQWKPERNGNLLKMKPAHDAEGTVVGLTFGRETDKGSKLLGMMGALTVEWNGVKFNLSGFTNEERTVNDPEYAALHPDEVAPMGIEALAFPIGSRVTFKYRELSDTGVPKDARYYRKYEED